VPTFGWINEDVWERYLESQAQAEPSPPGPARVRCPFCDIDFETIAGMLSHLAKQHRGDRPILLFRGAEPLTNDVMRVGVRLRSEDVVCENCSNVLIAIDGSSAWPIHVADLPTFFAEQRDSIVDLQLVNQFDRSAQPIATRYRIRFQVPEKWALDAVDRAFRKHFSVESLDFGAVDAFLSDRACLDVTRPYAVVSQGVV
jgi:hypothetical protein